MKLIVFGLSVSSAWGNGHATLWRGLIRALAAKGHSVVFYERNTDDNAAHRDCFELPNGELILYSDFDEIRSAAGAALQSGDVGVVTSHCPDALAATDLLLSSSVGTRAFYDLDTPITLSRIARGESVAYVGERGLRDFDIVLSYTGGPALKQLQHVLGARRVSPLYGAVDPRLHAPKPVDARYRADLSYLGAYAADRQAALEKFFLAPARARLDLTFAIAGSSYPSDFAWAPNIKYLWHVPPSEHTAYYCSSRLHLNVTPAPMAELGYCPSEQLFEAAASGVPLISDGWSGLSHFYEPGRELIVAHDTDDVLNALDMSDAELRAMSQLARERTLSEHTMERRADQLLDILTNAAHAGTREFEREAAEPTRTV
ncbi:MAG TPA: glycosyltransferase [Polyangiales bacterium]|nr:glycosyltransferase [Polyangiales bacterium]